MAVIALPLISPQGAIGPVFKWGLRAATRINRSPFNGATTTLERPGGPQVASLTYASLSGANAARLRSFLMQTRGQAQRFYVPDFSYTPRGSFPATELLSNSTFANGTTGWSTYQSTLSVTDSLLRAKADGTAQNFGVTRTGIAVTQYAPHVLRAYFAGSRVFSPQLILDLNNTSVTVSSAANLVTVAATMTGTTTSIFAYHNTDGGPRIDRYLDYSLLSLSRCALVDNGPNLLLQSDALENTGAWGALTANGLSTVQANSLTGPDGATTAESLVENSSNSSHFREQTVTGLSSAAADYAFSVALWPGTRGFALLQMLENTGSTGCGAVWFNLSTGAIGTIGSAGANWSNTRAFISPLGSGWYRCTIVARKTNAATSVSVRIQMANADNVAVYTGDGASNIGAWRATLAQSSVPTRLRQTTSSATTGTAQTGNTLHLKGLPASTSGLLLQDDQFEVITPSSSELKRVSTSLDSDASGLGYQRFESPLRESPADNAPVIVCRPMMRCLLDSNSVDWAEIQGDFTDTEFSVVEDVVPVAV